MRSGPPAAAASELRPSVGKAKPARPSSVTPGPHRIPRSAEVAQEEVPSALAASSSTRTVKVSSTPASSARPESARGEAASASVSPKSKKTKAKQEAKQLEPTAKQSLKAVRVNELGGQEEDGRAACGKCRPCGVCGVHDIEGLFLGA